MVEVFLMLVYITSLIKAAICKQNACQFHKILNFGFPSSHLSPQVRGVPRISAYENVYDDKSAKMVVASTTRNSFMRQESTGARCSPHDKSLLTYYYAAEKRKNSRSLTSIEPSARPVVACRTAVRVSRSSFQPLDIA